MGYATYIVQESVAAPLVGAVAQLGYGHPCPYATYERGPEGLENEMVRVLIDPTSGGIASFVDKRTDRRLIQAQGTAPSLLRYAVERPRHMSAWEIEHTGPEVEPSVRRIARKVDGVYACTVEVSMRIGQSDVVLTYELRHGDPNLYVHLRATWLERGGADVGTPSLRLTIPAALDSQIPVYEIPFGAIERHMQHGEEVPALRWAAVTGTVDGAADGLLLVTDSKHGYSHAENQLALTLIRSSFDPDPLPEIGEHEVHVALRPLGGGIDVSHATAAARVFDHPVRVVSTDAHDGRLPLQSKFLTWEATASVLNAVKQAEDSEAIIVRAYNPTDEEDSVRLQVNRDLMGTITEAVEVDLLERPVTNGSTRVQDGTVHAVIPRRGIWSALVTVASK
jgi:alpha-mannosidase